MKTKFKKVSVADRLPDKSGTYDSNLGEIFYNNFRQKFEHNDKWHDLFPDYWLLEVSDYEDEMKELLTELTEAIEFESIIIKENIDNDGWENYGGRLYDKAKSLLTKIKQQS